MQMTAFEIMKAVKGVIAVGNWVKEGFSDGIEWLTIDAPAPNEVIDVVDMLTSSVLIVTSFGVNCVR